MMRIALCLIKRLGWWCEDMQSFKNYYLVATIPLILYTTLPPSSEAIIIMAFVYNTEGGGGGALEHLYIRNI